MLWLKKGCFGNDDDPRIIEELLEWKSSGSGLETRN
jgi:hypothetical protein